MTKKWQKSVDIIADNILNNMKKEFIENISVDSEILNTNEYFFMNNKFENEYFSIYKKSSFEEKELKMKKYIEQIKTSILLKFSIMKKIELEKITNKKKIKK